MFGLTTKAKLNETLNKLAVANARLEQIEELHKGSLGKVSRLTAELKGKEANLSMLVGYARSASKTLKNLAAASIPTKELKQEALKVASKIDAGVASHD